MPSEPARIAAKPRGGEPRLMLDPVLDRNRSGIRTMGDAVFLSLRDEILSGELGAGQPLRLQAVAQRLEVSMQPVREAIRRLENIGLVEVISNRGARVRGVSIEDLRDTYLVRLELEGFAIREAATRFTEDHWAEANQHLVDQTRFESVAEFELARAAHTAFHFSLYNVAGSSWLVRSIQPLWENSERYRIRTLARRGSLADRRVEHERILDACRRRDPEAAVTELVHHLRLTANLAAASLGGGEIY